MSDAIILKIYRSGKSRQISVVRLFPPSWRAVAAKIREADEDHMVVEFKAIYKEGEE